jgi:hypothetical protein
MRQSTASEDSSRPSSKLVVGAVIKQQLAKTIRKRRLSACCSELCAVRINSHAATVSCS